MAFTLDARPHVIGDLILMKGTFVGADAGTEVDLSDFFSDILYTVTNGHTSGGMPLGNCNIVGPSTIQLNPGIHGSQTGNITVSIVGKR